MFHDLDTALRLLLADPAAPAPVFNAQVTFVTPDKNFNPAQPTINLFLHDVKENHLLRDPTPIIERIGNSYVSKPPPARYDCSYLVTTWSALVGAAKVAAEHELLALTLNWLQRFGTIPAAVLLGSLASQLYPPPLWIAQPEDAKNPGDFWLALGIPPRSAFYLTATVALASGTQATGDLVTTRTTSSSVPPTADADAWFQIGGRVLAQATGVAVPGAVVEITDAGLETTTRDDGRYSFTRVPVGNRIVRVSAVGFAQLLTTITVQGRPGDYDLILI